MITVPPADSAGDASLPPDELRLEESKPEEHKKKIPLASIPATISIGLLIALLYLGGRIITAQRPAKPTVVKVTAPVPAAPPAPASIVAKPVADVEPVAVVQPPPSVPPAKPVPSPVAQQAIPEPAADAQIAEDVELPVITPEAGQHYIQVGALDMSAEATRRFVQRLRGDKLDPHVAPGPGPGLMRVLLGPFDGPGALNEKKAQLDAEGIASFVRKY
jgi:cell division protein FtsN